MNNQAKDKNPNKQEATSWIAITYKNDQGFGLKINNKKKNPAGGLEPRPARVPNFSRETK